MSLNFGERTMHNRSRFKTGGIVTALLVCLLLTGTARAKEKVVDICSLVSAEQLAGIHKKKLFPTEQRRSCFWSEEPGAMAYLQIGYQKKEKELREYFSKELPPQVKLEEIRDLGDGGLLAINGEYLEVIVINKKNIVLKSTVSFLEIEPGSNQQKQLWDMYRAILKEL